MALYPDGSTEQIASSRVDENSAGNFLFDQVAPGKYYVCMSREYDVLGLSVTTQNAGDDVIDSDFDDSPCAYNIVVNNQQGADIDLGLVGERQEPSDTPDSTPGNTGHLNQLQLVTETLSFNHQWQTASNQLDPNDWVFFHSAPSSNGAQRGLVRMQSTNNNIQFRFQEWSNLDGSHTNESIDIVAIQRGKWASGNQQLEVGTASIDGTGNWKTIHFGSNFATPPTVILSLQTANGLDAVDVHVRNISTTSMEVALLEEQAKMGSGHTTETVAYLLVASDKDGFDLGNPQATRFELPFRNTGIQVNHDWQSIADAYQIRLEEDQTSDQETFHVFETVHVVNINGIYLTQIASANGGDPAVLRSREN